jgi:hypothetical protein
MSEAPEEEIDLDEMFGVQQTPDAKLIVKVSYADLYEGRPWYPAVEYGDGPRVLQYDDPEEGTITVIESEDDLRKRVTETAVRALEESRAAFIAQFDKQKKTRAAKRSAPTNEGDQQ